MKNKKLENKTKIVLQAEPDPENPNALRVKIVEPKMPPGEEYLDKDGLSDLFDDKSEAVKVKVRDSRDYRVFGVTADRDENSVAVWTRKKGGSVCKFPVPEEEEGYTDFFMLIGLAKSESTDTAYRVFDPPISIIRVRLPLSA